ncbi:hypothetical protein HK405_007151, partial [Cladochytrium tenue]
LPAGPLRAAALLAAARLLRLPAAAVDALTARFDLLARARRVARATEKDDLDAALLELDRLRAQVADLRTGILGTFPDCTTTADAADDAGHSNGFCAGLHPSTATAAGTPDGLARHRRRHSVGIRDFSWGLDPRLGLVAYDAAVAAVPDELGYIQTALRYEVCVLVDQCAGAVPQSHGGHKPVQPPNATASSDSFCDV